MFTNSSNRVFKSKRGQKTCPKCLTLQSNRAVFCKRCENSFRNNEKRNRDEQSTSVCKLLTSDSNRNVYSVRLLLQGPDYRGFVEHQLYPKTGENSNQNKKSIVKCLVDSCLKKSQSELPICPHIESTFKCHSQAEVLPINLEMIVNLQIPISAKAAIEKRLNDTRSYLVQRVSRQVMVVNNSLDPTEPIDLKHCTFYTENPTDDIGSKDGFSCSCKSHIKKRSISNKIGRPLKQSKKYVDSKITTPSKCWHYYACIAAFASQQKLIKEFGGYIKLHQMNLVQCSENKSLENIKVDVYLGGDTLIMDCDSDIFNMTDFNSDPCLNTSNYPLSSITPADNMNSPSLNLESEKDRNKSMECLITDMDITENLPIEICSTKETLDFNENLGNEIFSPVEIVDVFTSDIDNFLSTCGDATDQSSIEIITLDKVQDMVENSIEFDINNEVTVGNEIDQAILLNDDNMFIQLNDRDTLVFPEDEDILSDGTFDLHCTGDISKSPLSHDNPSNKKRIFKRSASTTNTSTSLSKTLTDDSIYNASNKIDVESSTPVIKNANANMQKSLSKETQLDFLEWLASVTERINETMHFQLIPGKPDPLVFYVNHTFFQSLCTRMSPDPTKRRMPDLTSQYKPNKPPFGSHTMFTWRLTNIFQIKNIFGTPKVPLKLTRVFIRNPNGTYSPTNEENLKTATKTTKCKEPEGSEIKQNLVMTYLKIDKSIPFRIEWIPDMFPVTKTGELRIMFEFGHRQIIRA